MSKTHERPLYRTTEKSFIGHTLVEAGEEVEFDGVPGTNLVPLNAAAEEAKETADAEIARADDKLLAANAPVTRTITAPAVDSDIEKKLAAKDRAHAKELEDQAKAHAKELADLREQAKQEKRTGSTDPNDPDKDPTLVKRGGETEAATPVEGQETLHSDPNSALSKSQRKGAVDASKGGDGKNDLTTGDKNDDLV